MEVAATRKMENRPQLRRKKNTRNQSVLGKRGLGAEKLLPENWVCLLVGIKPVDTTKPKIWRRKD